MIIKGDLRRGSRFQMVTIRTCKNCAGGYYKGGEYKCGLYPTITYGIGDESKYVCQNWGK